jgi:hypothetical protein
MESARPMKRRVCDRECMRAKSFRRRWGPVQASVSEYRCAVRARKAEHRAGT